MIFYHIRLGVGYNEKIKKTEDVLRDFKTRLLQQVSTHDENSDVENQIEIHSPDFTEVDEDRIR